MLLLLVVFSLYLLGDIIDDSCSFLPQDGGNVFVEVSGCVKNPGVYSFAVNPCLNSLLRRCEGLSSYFNGKPFLSGGPYECGLKIHIQKGKTGFRVSTGEMSSFNKLTLGIPLSLNKATIADLTAIPGVGPKTAETLVRERCKMGGFDELEDVLTVRGIGKATYERIKPFLKL